MRRRVRLTGRKQLPKNCVELKILYVNEKRILTMDISNKKPLYGLPKDARIKVKLVENKVVETFEFGTIGNPIATRDIKRGVFYAPSCQLRVVSASAENPGLLLGSTDPWTLRADNQNEGQADRDGILLFQPGKIAPRAWKLELRSDDFPIVYVDDQIPDPRVWAKSDPVFTSSVFPMIIERVFEKILNTPSQKDVDWMAKWITWADMIAPGSDLPVKDDKHRQEEWIGNLVDSFCDKHNTLGSLLDTLKERYS
jgi:hypothetical protein